MNKIMMTWFSAWAFSAVVWGALCWTTMLIR